MPSNLQAGVHLRDALERMHHQNLWHSCLQSHAMNIQTLKHFRHYNPLLLQ